MCRLKTHGSLCTRSAPFTNWGNTAALGIALIHIWWFQVPGLVCDTDMAWLDAQKRLMGNYQDGGWSGYPVLTIAILKKKHYLWYLRYQYCTKNSSLSRNNIFLSSMREFLRKEKSQSFNGFAPLFKNVSSYMQFSKSAFWCYWYQPDIRQIMAVIKKIKILKWV